MPSKKPGLFPEIEFEKDATLSPCRFYRYLLTRRWNADLNVVAFVGLNPSTADETEDDPTIRKCIGFARKWGYGGIAMVNLFSLRSTNPRGLLSSARPYGPPGSVHDPIQILRNHFGPTLTVCAWGNSAPVRGMIRLRAEQITRNNLTWPLHCLRTNNDGSPSHPLYLPGNLQPVPWEWMNYAK